MKPIDSNRINFKKTFCKVDFSQNLMGGTNFQCTTFSVFYPISPPQRHQVRNLSLGSIEDTINPNVAYARQLLEHFEHN